MDLIKTSIGITKTIKNVGRLREILSVFGRNGFSELIVKSGVDKIIPGFVLPSRVSELKEEDLTNEEWWELIGERVRKSFEELGPSFVKLGQLLATREDILPPPLIAELKKLQNQVKGIPFDQARAVMEGTWEDKIENIFSEFEEKPIGTASIGVAYRAKLKDGRDVVVKVRRPGISKILNTDFEIILYLATRIEKTSNEIRYLGISKAIADFFKSTQNELNLMVEAQNCERMAKNLSRIDKEGVLVIPKIYREFCGTEVLVMEFLDGKPFNEFNSLESLGPDVVEKLEKSVELFTHTLLSDGFFHADLHGGNFFVLKDRRIGIIDFGLMGSLSKKNRANLIAILYAVISQNYDNLVYEFLEVADYDSVPNHEELIRDIKDAISPYIGLSVQETDMTELVRGLVTTLAKHQLYLPREWFIIFRALMTLDGVGKSINLDLNIFKVLEKDLDGLVQDLFSRKNAEEELMWVAKDVINSLRIVPKHMRWFLKEISKNNYAIELRISDLDKHTKSITKSFGLLGLALIDCVCILTGALFVKDINVQTFSDIPILTWVFWTMGFYLFIRITLFRKI